MSNKSTKMSNRQYQDFRAAQVEGDDDRAQRIYDLGYQPNYEPSMLFKEDEPEVVESKKEETVDAPKPELDEEDVLADIAAGLDNKEIQEKYGITAQKLGAIKKKAK